MIPLSERREYAMILQTIESTNVSDNNDVPNGLFVEQITVLELEQAGGPVNCNCNLLE